MVGRRYCGPKKFDKQWSSAALNANVKTKIFNLTDRKKASQFPITNNKIAFQKQN